MNAASGLVTRRIVVLGTGTNVGKTYVASRLAVALAKHPLTASVTAIKPIESGTGRTHEWDDAADPTLRAAATCGTPELVTDAAVLCAASSPSLAQPVYAYEFAEPVSPHLAAKRSGTHIQPTKVLRWVDTVERLRRPSNGAQQFKSTSRIRWTLIETAGAAFSPLESGVDNVTLAMLLDPALWILVAPDRLGLLHDMTATLRGMQTVSRQPDFVVLSQGLAKDDSTGTNANELQELGIANVLTTVENDAEFSDQAVEAITTKALAC